MFYHDSVMLNEVLDLLCVKRDGIYFDGTLGGGGHSLEIMKRGGRVIATDVDGDAIEYADALFRSEGFLGRYELVRDNFKRFTAIADKRGIEEIDGAVLDLGVSSHQFDEAERGFSYRYDAELDMRMDRRSELTARDVVNEYSPLRLMKILYEYGEESYAKKIVENIVRERAIEPIETTGRLAKIISESVPYRKGGHPAKKTFQALRIEVNDELGGLETAVKDIARRLVRGGRLCVLTFHSLEDKAVKNAMREMAADCICDKSLPVCVCGHKAEIRVIKTEKKATKEETDRNPRSKSASLRVAEKL